MYCFQINPWSKDAECEHTSTKWEIASDEHFVNILETATTTKDNTINAYTTSIVVPVGSTYWIRATRIFAALTSANHTLNPVPIKASNLDNVVNNNIIHSDSIRIEQPFVYVNTDEFEDPNRDYFTIRTSKFRCKQDGHISTHWIITSQQGDVLFTSLNDVDNKEEIQIEKIRDIKNVSSFIIYAIHTSTNGVESKPGIYNFMNLAFEFDIKGLTDEIEPQRDLELFITPSDARDKYVTKVFLRTPNDDGDITNGVDVTPARGVSTITIPGRELVSDRKYYLDVFAYDRNGEYSTRRLTLYTKRRDFNHTLYPVTFKKEIEIYPSSQYSGLELPRSFTTFQLPNGKVLIPSAVTNNTSVYEFNILYNSTQDGGKVVLDLDNRFSRSDIRLPSSQVTGDNAYIKLFNNSILIMDCGSVEQGTQQTKPRFFKYIIDNNGVLSYDRSSLEASRTEETKSLGSTNAITQVSQTELWYIPSVTLDDDKCIKSLNLETLEINKVIGLDVASLNKTDLEQATSFALIFNRSKMLMHIISNVGKEIILDPISRTVKQIRDVKFTEWATSDIKAVELPNGDYLVLNIKNIKANNSVMYYDCETSEYTPIAYSPANNHTYIGGIQPTSGNSFFINRTSHPGGAQDFTVTRVF